MSEGWALALHGGAGTMNRKDMTAEKEATYHAALRECAAAGSAILAAGGHAQDAVEAAVRALEDNPLFNAGRGAVLTSDGTFEHDAAIMNGADRSAGAVTGTSTVANPISLARQVKDQTDYVALSGQGAERFAREMGVPEMSADYFDTPYRREQLTRAKAAQKVVLDHADETEFKTGTVGAVARDAAGHLAAATSTGGMTNKRPGRVGDAPMFGAGTWADDRSCAVSGTGHGEYFIRLAVAHDIAARMLYSNQSLEEAASAVVMDDLPKTGGRGGVIAVAQKGCPVAPFNTSGMYCAIVCQNSEPETAIFASVLGN